jgi:diguanylate cyclase (GGDEF)-like protein
MTLFKQLFIGTSIAFLLIVAATETIYIQNAHKYLQEQLASHAQDASTSLGMVLPASMAEGDMVRAEVTVNAMFDRGYYQSIRVLNVQGETLILKTLSPTPADVPQWFVDLFPLQAPSAESLVSKGWRQLGRVVVSSHPNFAYKQLWHTLQEATLWLSLIYFLALGALHSFLTRILKPLRDIEDVAQAISERDFKLIDLIPRARELRSVVAAINSMSQKLRGIIDHEVAQATRFRNESTKDVLTGLENRRGFELHMEVLLEDGLNLESGVMYMLQIDDFQGYNAKHGFQQGDALLRSVSDAIRSVAIHTHMMKSRINGSTFVVVARDISRPAAEQLGADLCLSVSGVLDGLKHEEPLSFGCGAVYFSGQAVTLAGLMSQCDMATLQSLNQGKRMCEMRSMTEDQESKGSQYWKRLISEAIKEERLALFTQPVMNIDAEGQLQVEVFVRLKDEEGILLPADQVIPMANRHHLNADFDLAILKRLFGRMKSGLIADDEVAINLSVHSLEDATLRDWLVTMLREDQLLAQRVVFELTEFGLVHDRAKVDHFVGEVRKLGAKFAVDNFGLHHSAFEYLQEMKPRYVKLSLGYIRDLAHNPKHQFFISSVVKITRPLEVRVIAVGVENAAMLELLRDLGVDGYQGYITGKMVELD